ncbi:hypothetical protein ARMGADRAFT_1084430 [Armillaria gallica]|uniref:Uncharacterized protein n=1 Tax=Armillaria gallica TaxID=47427 RepID=A0A2H3DHB7_ARMGA|nr:hypothetical protein ARMGADRAFT_1084430 [Armillaria gallica]
MAYGACVGFLAYEALCDSGGGAILRPPQEKSITPDRAVLRKRFDISIGLRLQSLGKANRVQEQVSGRLDVASNSPGEEKSAWSFLGSGSISFPFVLQDPTSFRRVKLVWAPMLEAQVSTFRFGDSWWEIR